MKQVTLYFNTQMPGKQVSKIFIQLVYFYKGKSEKESPDVFSLKIKIVYNIISRSEKKND